MSQPAPNQSSTHASALEAGPKGVSPSTSSSLGVGAPYMSEPITRTPGMRTQPSSYLAAANASSSSAVPSSAAAAEKRRWTRAFYVALIAIHLAWLHVHIRIFGQFVTNFLFGKWSQMNRKIVIIGDDVALGIGDWVTLCSQPGLQGRINAVINKDVLSRIVGRGVVWTALTAAKAGSTTEDWLPVNQMTNEQKVRFAARNGAVSDAKAVGQSRPGTTTNAAGEENNNNNNKKEEVNHMKKNRRKRTKPFWDRIGFSVGNSSRQAMGKRGSDSDEGDDVEEDDSKMINALAAAGIRPSDAMALKGASLFDQNFNPNVGVHRDADIVVIVLGSKDKCTILETVQNMSKICSELLKLGKSVIVTTIPMSPNAFATNREMLTRFRDRNEAMQHMVSGMQGLASSSSSFSTNNTVVASATSRVSFKTSFSPSEGQQENDEISVVSDGAQDGRPPASVTQQPNYGSTAAAEARPILKRRGGDGGGGKPPSRPSHDDDIPPPPRSFTAAAPSLNSQRIVLSRVAESLTQDHCFRFNGKTFNGQGYTKAAEVIMQQLKPMMRSIDGRREIKRME